GRSAGRTAVAGDDGHRHDPQAARHDGDRAEDVAQYEARGGQAAAFLVALTDLLLRDMAEHDAGRPEHEREDQRQDRHGVRLPGGTGRRVPAVGLLRGVLLVRLLLIWVLLGLLWLLLVGVVVRHGLTVPLVR